MFENLERKENTDYSMPASKIFLQNESFKVIYTVIKLCKSTSHDEKDHSV